MMEKPDIIFIMNDAWVIDPMLMRLKEIYTDKPRPKIVTYHPVDAKNHLAFWYKNWDIVDEAVVYNQFGYEVTKLACDRDLKIIGHGVDSSIFFQMFEKREEAKLKLFPKEAKLDDTFIILNAMRNQPRKKLDVTMRAFALFAKDKPDNVKLYMHSGVRDSHLSIPEYAVRLGIENRLIITSKVPGLQRVPYETLNVIYNACDIGVNTSLGEGFGLPTAEHAVTGAAQITGNFSASGEVFGGAAILVEPVQEITQDNIMTTGWLLDPVDVAEAFELLYSDTVLRNNIAKLGQDKFKTREFSWEYISEQWDKLFTSLV